MQSLTKITNSESFAFMAFSLFKFMRRTEVVYKRKKTVGSVKSWIPFKKITKFTCV